MTGLPATTKALAAQAALISGQLAARSLPDERHAIGAGRNHLETRLHGRIDIEHRDTKTQGILRSRRLDLCDQKAKA